LKIKDYQVVEQTLTLLDGFGHELIGLQSAIERKLETIGAPGITWRLESAETGLVAALSGRRRDVLLIEHDRFREYQVLISARPLGTVLQVSWLLLASLRLPNDVRRLIRLDADRGERFELGSELDLFDMLDLSGFISLTRLALRSGIRELTGAEEETEIPTDRPPFDQIA